MASTFQPEILKSITTFWNILVKVQPREALLVSFVLLDEMLKF
jgi:hypothetical protein